MRTLSQYRSFPRPVQLLLLNQLTINIGFYMLIPYLAAHLSDDLGLATWVVGLILGIRNFSQQGMFLIGGSLADRFGYKPLIVAGCTLRTLGFALLGVVDSIPALIAASAATGFAGALFNPAVRAYLANDSGERRVEAFALFSIFYQAGILLGPLIGLALTGVAFSLTCLVAAGVFALLTVLQIRALPQRGGCASGTGDRMLAQWRGIAGNRPFVLFSAAMIGSYVLSFQVYLALPLQARIVVETDQSATALVAGLFAVSGLVTVLGQLRVTAWCKARWGAGRSMTAGLAVLAAAFLPLLAAEASPAAPGTAAAMVVGVMAVLLAAAILALGTAIVFPFEMDTIVSLSGDRLVATHYGLYNTVCGVGILLGNLGTGWALDLARTSGISALPWLVLISIGGGCTLAMRSLRRRGLLPAEAVAHRLRGRHRVRSHPGGASTWTPGVGQPARRSPVLAVEPGAHTGSELIDEPRPSGVRRLATAATRAAAMQPSAARRPTSRTELAQPAGRVGPPMRPRRSTAVAPGHQGRWNGPSAGAPGSGAV